MKRPKRTAALTIRMTQQTRERLDAMAYADRISSSEAAERAINDGLFWRAFQRTVMAEAEALPTPEEIKAALKVMEALRDRAPPSAPR